MAIPNRLLVVLMPAAMIHHRTIMHRIVACDYTIIQTKHVQLTSEQAVNVLGVALAGDQPICALFVAAPMAQMAGVSHRHRLLHVVLDEFKDMVLVSDDSDRQLEFFFGKWEKPRHAATKPTIQQVNDFLNEHVHPVLMQAIFRMVEKDVDASDECIVQLAKQIIAVDAEKDPMNASRWTKFDRKFDEVEKLKLLTDMKKYESSDL